MVFDNRLLAGLPATGTTRRALVGPERRAALVRVEECLGDAIEHAARALIGVENLRDSADPADQQLYRELHDLVIGLAGARTLLVAMRAEPAGGATVEG